MRHRTPEPPIQRRHANAAWRAVVAVCALLVPGAGALAAQARDATQGPDDPAPTSPAPAVAGRALTADLLLGAVFATSLAAIEIEGLDEFDHVLEPRPEGRNAFHRRVPRNLGRFPVAAGLAGTTYLVGEIAGSETVARVGLRTVETLLVNMALTTTIKVGVGRARPDSGMEEDQLRPFSFDTDRWSFPSGHTSTVFALATAVSTQLRDEAPWVPFVAYPVAAWTGLSRVLDSRHWPTDVLAGAALGIFSARLVERLHGPETETSLGSRRPRLLLATGEHFVLGLSFSTN